MYSNAKSIFLCFAISCFSKTPEIFQVISQTGPGNSSHNIHEENQSVTSVWNFQQNGEKSSPGVEMGRGYRCLNNKAAGRGTEEYVWAHMCIEQHVSAHKRTEEHVSTPGNLGLHPPLRDLVKVSPFPCIIFTGCLPKFLFTICASGPPLLQSGPSEEI